MSTKLQFIIWTLSISRISSSQQPQKYHRYNRIRIALQYERTTNSRNFDAQPGTGRAHHTNEENVDDDYNDDSVHSCYTLAASFILPLYCFRIKRPLLCKQQVFWTVPLAKAPTNKCFISLIRRCTYHHPIFATSFFLPLHHHHHRYHHGLLHRTLYDMLYTVLPFFPSSHRHFFFMVLDLIRF